MKIQIDFTEKTIKVDSKVKLADFFDKLQQILPDEWDGFSLETNTVIYNWSNPIYIDNSRPFPWYGNPVYCGTGASILGGIVTTSTSYQIPSGTTIHNTDVNTFASGGIVDGNKIKLSNGQESRTEYIAPLSAMQGICNIEFQN